jgi:hypothetical protein
MPVDVKQYGEQLLAKSKTITDEQRQAFLTVLQDGEVSKEFSSTLENHMLKSDFDREMGRLKKKESDYQTWYEGQVKTAEQNKKAVEEATSTVEAYRSKYGEIDGRPLVNTPVNGDYISKKDYEDEIARRDKLTIQLVKGAAKITADHLHRFHEPPDLDAIEKIAIDEKLPLESAYQKYIEPKSKALSTADTEARVKAAREEGLKEGLSRSGIPVDTRPKEPHPFFDSYKTAKAMGDKAPNPLDSFTRGWNEADKAAAAK